MRVLVAPDKFRGTLTARQAAEAIEAGWRRARPADLLDLVPMADGGEGTMDAVVSGAGAEVETVRVTGPLGDAVDAAFGLVPGEDGPLGVVEMARASGLDLIAASRRDPKRATTRGTGELMARAIERGATRLLVCLGGSATNDGGSGMAAALGCRFLDAKEQPLADGGAALLSLARIDVTPMPPSVRALTVWGACDVDNPLTGPTGASAIYGPQKGASDDDVWLLDRALGHLAAIAHRDLGIDLKDEPGAGAAGGLGFGLLAFVGARLRRGVDVVMDSVGLRERMADVDLVITGEGALDEQSLRGKVPAGILEAARTHGVPVAILCGRAEIRPEGVPVIAMVDLVGAEAALGDARTSLEEAAHALASRADVTAKGAPR
jgi:glycerate 2-kinase